MFRPLYHETEKTRSHVRYTSLKNIDEGTYWIWNLPRWIRKVTLVFTKFLNFCQRWNEQSITWNICWGPPSSGEIWKQLGRRKQIWKSRLTNVKGKWSNWLPFKKFLFPHLCKTPGHLWDQSAQIARHRNPLKNGSLSENVMKEGERVPFQPLHWRRYRREWHCGHFATWADLIAVIVFEILPFLWTQFVKSKFE